ncbi:hypothetical protein EJB05_04585, partial [Eragrostis curvula]
MAAVAGKTASVHRAALVKSTHQFDIVGYSVLKALGGSHTVKSDRFIVADHVWAVLCHFEGHRLAAVSLERLVIVPSRIFNVKAMVSFTIGDPTSTAPPIQIGNSEEILTFTNASPVSRRPVPYASREQEARYVKDDRLTIRCAVRVLAAETWHATYCFVAAPPPPSISLGLAEMLASGERADVAFDVEGCTFHAHRLVLAMRSPVFRAKFFGDSRDSEQDVFAVADMSAPVFRVMLRFIYTDEVDLEMEGSEESQRMAMAGDLLVAADLYDLERLRLLCEKTLWDSVRGKAGGVGRAVSVLALVNGRLNCRRLDDLCAGYVAGAWDAAKATEEYAGLKATCPDALADVLERVMDHRQQQHRSSLSTTANSVSTYVLSSSNSKGKHRFTILGYSVARRTHGVGEFVRSGTFEAGGHEWYVTYYPRGVSGTFKIGDPDGDDVDTTFEHFDHDFSTNAAVDPGPPLVFMDCPSTATVEVPEMVAPPSNISWHLERLLDSGFGSDVAFVVEGVEFRAHTLLLYMRSPALFNEARAEVVKKKKSKSKKKEDLVFWIDGVTAVVFKAVLHFVYTDELPPLEDLVLAAGEDRTAMNRTRMAGDLLAAADRFQLAERMRPLCENLLCEFVTPETAASTLKLAERHRCPELKAFCLDYISSPGLLKAVVASDDYKDLAAGSAQALADIISRIAANS